MDVRLWIATGFGLGWLPKMPGTFGTLLALPLVWLMASLALPLQFLLVAALFTAGVPLCRYAGMKLGKADDGRIVFDEIVGFMVTILLLPLTPMTLLLGFVAFRFFDIVKPAPIGWIDRRVGGGLGVMLDDVVAGLFAHLFCRLSLLLLGGMA